MEHDSADIKHEHNIKVNFNKEFYGIVVNTLDFESGTRME